MKGEPRSFPRPLGGEEPRSFPRPLGGEAGPRSGPGEGASLRGSSARLLQQTDAPGDPWWQRALDVLLPPRCVGCGTRGADICATCVAAIHPLSTVCPRCSLPTPGGRLCNRCSAGRSPLRAILARYPLEGALRAALLSLKYRSRTRLAPLLSTALDDCLVARPLQVDLVVPVPLSQGRLRARGFNQSELLARPFAHRQGLIMATSVLVRTRDTGQQTRLPAAARRRNVAGAFAAPYPALVLGKRVLLVDDVCTTGATLEACAAVLREAGAEGVWAAVVARELPRRRTG